MSRDFHLPGRSPVIAGEGMAATSHPLATLAAIDVLRAGGNAVDAAIAAVAVLCVIEPHMTGIGGDCFALIAEPGKPVWGYNGCGRSGAKASTEALLAKGMTRDRGDLAACGQRAGRDRGLGRDPEGARHAGRSTACWRRRSATPSTAFRSRRASPPTGRAWSASSATAPARPSTICSTARAPAEGDVIRLPALAETLKAIAKNGPRAFYEGPIAEDMVATLAAAGSVLTVEDFARHRGEALTPISTNYRGIDLVEIPPNTQGLTALVMLNILENFDLAALDALGAERFHLMLEAARLGFAVRDTHIAEPSHMRVAAAALNDKAFAKKACGASIDRSKRVPLPTAPDARQRHRLSHRGRPRPPRGLVHQLAVFGVRLGDLHREDRHHVQQPRLRLRAQSRPSERARPEQAADAHHHSGAGDARRPLRHRPSA